MRRKPEALASACDGGQGMTRELPAFFAIVAFVAVLNVYLGG